MKSIKLLTALMFALILIFFNKELFQLTKKIFKIEDSRPVIGILKSYKGDVHIKKEKSLTYNKAKNKTKLRQFDTLMTSKNSKAFLQIFPNFQLEIEQNSKLFFEKKQNFSFITFFQGDFKILSSNSLGRLMISKSGQIQDIKSKFPKNKKAKNMNINLQEKINRMSLSNEYIRDVLIKRESFFKKCSMKFLRTNPTKKWEIHLNFTIRPNGKTSSVRLIRGTITDLKLKQCIMDAIERTVFKSFEGHPIIIHYPISLDYRKSLK